MMKIILGLLVLLLCALVVIGNRNKTPTMTWITFFIFVVWRVWFVLKVNNYNYFQQKLKKYNSCIIPLQKSHYPIPLFHKLSLFEYRHYTDALNRPILPRLLKLSNDVPPWPFE